MNGSTETYNYDSVTGNLSSKAGTTLTYNPQVTCSTGTRTIPHAVSAANGNTYTYNCNGSQTTRVIGGQTYTLGYDAENRLVSVSGPSMTASFVYDGDGRRVKSTINGTPTTFVGSHYEVTGSQITKYYFAGAQRIAMRKYTIPQPMTVEYLLSDHLGSTSITTDNTGEMVSEMRYKPWGEVRSSWTSAPATTPAYMLSNYTFTGQYSYMDDPSTTSVTEGFGLMFYNSRMYDPTIGRFAQADTIIPSPYNSQSYDRFAYVFNNPVSYTDPSGHCAVGNDGHILLDSNGHISKTDCSFDDFYNLSWEQRVEWLKLFVGEHQLGNWFSDILGAIEFMMNDPNLGDTNGAAFHADAGVLQEINNGWNMAQGDSAVGGQQAEAGAKSWANFFSSLEACQRQSQCNEDTLLDERLKGEDDGVNLYAFPLTNQSGALTSDDEKAQIELEFFLNVANTYRQIGISCAETCAGTLDPRTAGSTLSGLASWGGPLVADYLYGNLKAVESGIYP